MPDPWKDLEALSDKLEYLIDECASLTMQPSTAIGPGFLDVGCLQPRPEAFVDQHRIGMAGIVDALSEAVIVVDASGHVVLANPAYERLIDEVGSDCVLLERDGQPVQPEAMPLHRAARGETADLELTLLNPAGQPRLFGVTIRPIQPSGHGQATGVVTFRELHDRQLRRLEERFLALVAHELRAPLSSLQSYAELLISYLFEDLSSSETRSAVRRIYGLSERLSSMIDDLLDRARISTGKLRIARERVDLRTVVTESIDIATTLPGAPVIQFDGPDEWVTVTGDARRLGDVLLNLLTNAIKHASGTARIDVRLELDGEQAVISVEDFGPGIPPDDLPLIFSRHYQVQRDEDSDSFTPGLGLGLFIAQQIMTAHGGRIDVDSVLGLGARFTIRIPVN